MVDSLPSEFLLLFEKGKNYYLDGNWDEAHQQ